MINKSIVAVAIGLLCPASFAKLPATVLTDEAELKAAEAAAKTEFGNQVADFLLYKSPKATSAHHELGKKVNYRTWI